MLMHNTRVHSGEKFIPQKVRYIPLQYLYESASACTDPQINTAFSPTLCCLEYTRALSLQPDPTVAVRNAEVPQEFRHLGDVRAQFDVLSPSVMTKIRKVVVRNKTNILTN